MYRAPTFTLAAPRERAWWERALVSVGRHVHALRWLPAYRRAVGGVWVQYWARLLPGNLDHWHRVGFDPEPSHSVLEIAREEHP